MFSVPENLFPHTVFCTKKQQQKRSEKKTLKTKKQTEKEEEEEEEEGNGTKTLQMQTGQWGKLAQLRANQKRQQSFEIGLASAVCCCFLFSSSSSPGQVNNKNRNRISVRS